jgi:hypothetical protein
VVLLFVERLARFGVSVSLLRASVLAVSAGLRGQRSIGGGAAEGGGSGVGVPVLSKLVK